MARFMSPRTAPLFGYAQSFGLQPVGSTPGHDVTIFVTFICSTLPVAESYRYVVHCLVVVVSVPLLIGVLTSSSVCVKASRFFGHEVGNLRSGACVNGRYRCDCGRSDGDHTHHAEKNFLLHCCSFFKFVDLS